MSRDRDEERRRYRAGKAAELALAGDDKAAEEVLAGRCACCCGQRIPAGNVRAFYADERHRKRAHHRRLERLAEAAGVPTRLTVENLKATNGTGGRPTDAQAPRKRRQSAPRPGVSVYFPTPDALEVALAAIAKDRRAREGTALDSYLELLDQALEATRKALERRRARTT